MGKYGSPSAKPHRGWSNDWGLVTLIHERAGHITCDEKKALRESQLATTGQSKSGKRTWTGNKQALKNSQLPA